MQQVQNLELYVLDTQRSIKREGDCPNKPGSQYQAWCNIFPHIKITEIQCISTVLHVISDDKGTTYSVSTTTTTTRIQLEF
jgi:hypothetical protein